MADLTLNDQMYGWTQGLPQWWAWQSYPHGTTPPPFGAAAPVGPVVGRSPVPQDPPPSGPEALRIPIPQDPFPGYSMGGGGNYSRTPGLNPDAHIFENMPFLQSSPYTLQLPGKPNFPTPKFPTYPTEPVPQMAAPAPFDRSKIDAAWAKAVPPEYSRDPEQRLQAFLAGALGNYENRPGDRFGTILGRMAGGAAKGLYGDTLSERDRKDRREAEVRDYYARQAGLEANLENTRLGRQDRADQTKYSNETAVREDAFRKGQFDLTVQDLQRKYLKEGYDMDTAQAMAYWQAHIQQRQVGALEGRAAASMVSAAQRRGKAGTIGELEPGAAISTIIGNALTKKQPIPGLDLAALQQKAIAELNNDPNFRTTMDPTLKSQMVTQRTIALASQAVGANPTLQQGLLNMYRAVPLGSGTGTPSFMEGLGNFEDY